jgi:hypothetical protein
MAFFPLNLLGTTVLLQLGTEIFPSCVALDEFSDNGYNFIDGTDILLCGVPIT